MSKKKETKTLQPQKVIRKRVSSLEVGREYLKSEFGRLFPDESLRQRIDKRIESLTPTEFWRLLEAMSFSFRLNEIFWWVSDTSVSWKEEEWDVRDISYTGTFPELDRVAFSEKINGNFIKLGDYLSDYFKRHPKSDPKGFNQFRVDNKKVVYERVILIHRDMKVSIYDGTNRLIRQILNGERAIKAFVGRAKGKGKSRVGDSTFWLLKRLYEVTDEGKKEAILTVVNELIGMSLDGKEAVQSYWIEHARDKNTKKVGKELLKK